MPHASAERIISPLIAGRDLRRVSDLTREQVDAILSLASYFAEQQRARVRRENLLDGQVVAMVFEKPSLRTKVAFEVATQYLGGTPVFLSSSQIMASGGGLGRESIPDIARNLERFADLIIARVYETAVIDEMAGAISIPVINALCNGHHPTQALADLMAIRLHLARPAESSMVTFIGDGNNVATSLLQMCALAGINFTIACPPGYEIPHTECEVARSLAAGRSTISVLHDPFAAVEDADVVYTDTFVSMGQEDSRHAKVSSFADFQVNRALFERARPDAVFMHCLPAHRGEEVTDEVMDHERSIVFEQAACRLHIAKALLAMTLHPGNG